VPTPEARHFYQIAERIVADVEDARDTVKLIAEGKHGQLTVATLPGLGLTVIPAVIDQLRRERPSTRFRILTRSTDAVRLMIPSEQCDVALVEASADSYSGLTEILLFECVAVLPARHRLARHDTITPRLLADEPVATLYPDHPTTQQLQSAFFADQVPWAPIVESRLFATCCEIVAHGGSMSIVDPMTAEKYTNDAIVVRPFLPKIVFEVALTLPGDGPHSLLAQDFVAALKNFVQPFLLESDDRI
jgi:DNA-binding transcriptional LysR family regulator